MDFSAPGARILIVDDTKIQLKLAMNLLAPLGMQMDTAESGKEALALLQQRKYHLVFMDHMMPDMDGIETARRIRERKAGEVGIDNHEIPIIALTADTIEDAKHLFLEAGMNDFVAKPMQRELLYEVIQRWLPQELLVPQGVAKKSSEIPKEKEAGTMQEGTGLCGIDVAEGIRNAGSAQMLLQLFGDFYTLIDTKAAKIEKCMEEKRLQEYTIEVHALKNTARLIGAMELSECFWHLEQLGRAERLEEILRETPKVLAFYRTYKTKLEQYGRKATHTGAITDTQELRMYLRGIKDAVEAFDLDTMDAAMQQLEQCQLPESCRGLLEELKVFVADVAMEDIGTTVDKIQRELEKE